MMLPQLICLLFPAMACPQYVEYVPQLAVLEASQRTFDGKPVAVVGRVQNLDRWTSRGGDYKYERFELCDAGKCVRVFHEGWTAVAFGQLIRTRGTYYRVVHSGRYTFYNEIEAEQIEPLR